MHRCPTSLCERPRLIMFTINKGSGEVSFNQHGSGKTCYLHPERIKTSPYRNLETSPFVSHGLAFITPGPGRLPLDEFTAGLLTAVRSNTRHRRCCGNVAVPRAGARPPSAGDAAGNAWSNASAVSVERAL
jgi:hypothetical protein